MCEHSRNQVQDLNGFDYSASAELFAPHTQRGKGKFIYELFDTAAEALRCTVEKIPVRALSGIYLEINETRFGSQEIQYLYANSGYPLRALQQIKSRIAPKSRASLRPQ